jgi:DNA-binding transcriptional regulator YiaG
MATIAAPIEIKSRRRAPKATAAGRKLTPALKQVFDAVMAGDPHRGMTVREVEIPDPPKFSGSDFKATRARLGVSVTLFARLMGVSAKLVEHWEQGRRTPAPLACRLLERINADPAGYLGSLVQRRQIASTKA